MDLKERIQTDLKSFLKAGKSFEAGVLRMLNASIHNKEIEKRARLILPKTNLSGQAKTFDEKEIEEKSQLNNEELVGVISSEAKKRKEAIVEFERGGRNDLADKEKKELEILQKYLPEQLSEEEIRKLAKEAVDKTGAKEPKEMGKVMAELMPKIKGRADGALVGEIVKSFLAKLP